MENNEAQLPDGFISKEEWIEKGRDPELWRDPEEFKKRGEEILPIVKSNLEKTQKELSDVKSDMAKILDFNKRQEEKIREDERKKIEAEYEKKKEAAFKNDDIDALNAAEKERDAKTKELDNGTAPESEDEAKQAFTTAFNGWKERNPWYGTDEEVTKWADLKGKGILNMLIANGMSPDEALDEIAKDAKVLFAENFKNPNREKAADVETSGYSKSGDSSSMKKITDIENKEERATARKSFNRIKEQMKLKGREYTEKDYMESYI